jgi:hypothetical protein
MLLYLQPAQLFLPGGTLVMVIPGVLPPAKAACTAVTVGSTHIRPFSGMEFLSAPRFGTAIR